MSKNLWLIRHAKSSWNQENIRDWYRPLNERGYRDAQEMALRLRKSGVVPDLIVTSPAIRAYSTSMIFADVLNYRHDTIRVLSNLYGTSPAEYIAEIRKLADQHNTVMLFAHNPIISQTLELLAGMEQQDLPTTGMAHIQFAEKSWAACAERSGKLMLLDFPKNGLE